MSTCTRSVTFGLAGLLFLAGNAGPADAASSKRTEQLRRLAANYADCVVRTSAPVARAVILNNLDNVQIGRSASRLVDGSCFERAADKSGDSAGGMKFGDDSFRYAVAQALIRKDYPGSQHFDFASAPALAQWNIDPIDPNLTSGKSRKARKALEAQEKKLQIRALSRYGECVSRRNANAVHTLLLSSIGSQAETESFQKLNQALGECLTSGQVRFDRETLRGLLAVNFYRLAGPPADAEVAPIKVSS